MALSETGRFDVVSGALEDIAKKGVLPVGKTPCRHRRAVVDMAGRLWLLCQTRSFRRRVPAVVGRGKADVLESIIRERSQSAFGAPVLPCLDDATRERRGAGKRAQCGGRG